MFSDYTEKDNSRASERSGALTTEHVSACTLVLTLSN